MIPAMIAFTWGYCVSKEEGEDTGYSFATSLALAILVFLMCFLLGLLFSFASPKETTYTLYDMNTEVASEENVEMVPVYIKENKNISVFEDNSSISYLTDGKNGKKETVTVPRKKSTIYLTGNEDICVVKRERKTTGIWQIILCPINIAHYDFYVPLTKDVEAIEETEEKETEEVDQCLLSFLISNGKGGVI